MMAIGEPCIPSGIAHDLADCKRLAAGGGYPVIIRPAFTLGGTGGGIAATEAECWKSPRPALPPAGCAGAGGEVHRRLEKKLNLKRSGTVPAMPSPSAA